MKKLLFLLTAALVLSACEKDDPPAEFVADPADNAGNLLIINNSNKRLVLYKDEVPVRRISSSSSDYLANVPNASGEATELSLYDWEDVVGNVNNPPLDKVFKKWRVPLANSTAKSDQVTWHVSASSEYSTMATIFFNYYAGSDESVDIFLNGKTGAKLMSLAPGQQNRKIGLDYGNHTLAYHYWLSDQNTADGMTSIGWIEKQTVMGQEGNIWLVLNEARNEMTMVVPHHGSTIGDLVKYGKVTIENNTPNPLQIYVGQKLIEQVCYLESGSTRNLSTILGGEKYTFIMPITNLPDNEEEVASEDFTLRAVHITNSNEIKAEKITIIADETIIWQIP